AGGAIWAWLGAAAVMAATPVISWAILVSTVEALIVALSFVALVRHLPSAVCAAGNNRRSLQNSSSQMEESRRGSGARLPLRGQRYLRPDLSRRAAAPRARRGCPRRRGSRRSGPDPTRQLTMKGPSQCVLSGLNADRHRLEEPRRPWPAGFPDFLAGQ